MLAVLSLIRVTVCPGLGGFYAINQVKPSQCDPERGAITTLILPIRKLRLSTLLKAWKHLDPHPCDIKTLRFLHTQSRTNNNHNGDESKIFVLEATWHGPVCMTSRRDLTTKQQQQWSSHSDL